MKVVIMAGGQGTRFWPWSIKDKPKQFLSLTSEDSLLQQTYKRFHTFLAKEKIFVVTAANYVSLVKKQLPLLADSQIIIEPMQRDTGPCLGLTALSFIKRGDDEVFAAVPADHYISEGDSQAAVFKLAEEIAEQDRAIVTLGIKPTRPETGYGYIEADVNEEETCNVMPVKSFIEKPCLEKAEKLFKEENVFWNSGIFIWKPSTIAYYMETFQPEIWNKLQESEEVSLEHYSALPKISVDYAILEKAETIYTIPVNFRWEDIGSWGAWARLQEKTGEDNVLRGDIHLLSTSNCIIKSEDRRALVIGVEDLIIASTEDGLLVCHRSEEQRIKEILKELD